MKDGTVNADAFTLPVGYRPTGSANFAILDALSGTGIACRLVIFVGGALDQLHHALMISSR